jgi:hypothetical protein
MVNLHANWLASRWGLASVIAVFAIAALESPVLAGSLTQCETGQLVEEDGGRRGQIVGERDKLCLVRSVDGRLQSWIPVEQLSPGEATATPEEGTNPAEAGSPKAPPASVEKAPPTPSESGEPAAPELKSEEPER